MWELSSNRDLLIKSLEDWATARSRRFEWARVFLPSFATSRQISGPTPLEKMVSSLADAIRSGNNLDGWNRLDLVSEAEGRLESQWYNRWVGRFLLLAPVAWGWSSIWSASKAYGELRNDQLQSNSFLFWWIEGMDGRLGFYHQLPGAALITVILIVFIGITGFVSGQRNSRRFGELWPLLIQAQVHIGQRVTLTPDELRGAVSQTLRQISDATQEIKSLMESLSSLGTSLLGERDKLERYVSEQTKLVGGELSETVKSVGIAGRKLGESLREIKDAVSDLKTATTAVADLKVPAQQISDSASRVLREVDALVNGLTGLSQVLPTALDEPIGNVLGASELLAEVITRTTEHLTPLISELPNSPIGKIAESIEKLRRELDRLRETVQRQEP